MQKPGPGVLCILYSYWQLSWKYEIHKSKTAVNVEKKKCSEIPNHGAGREGGWSVLTSQKWLEIDEFVHTYSLVQIGFRVQSSSQLNTCLCFWKEPKWIPFMAINVSEFNTWFFFRHPLTQRIENEDTLWERDYPDIKLRPAPVQSKMWSLQREGQEDVTNIRLGVIVLGMILTITMSILVWQV